MMSTGKDRAKKLYLQPLYSSLCVFVIVTGMMTKMEGSGGQWAVVGSGDKQGYKVVSPAATTEPLRSRHRMATARAPPTHPNCPHTLTCLMTEVPQRINPVSLGIHCTVAWKVQALLDPFSDPDGPYWISLGPYWAYSFLLYWTCLGHY